MGSSVFSRENDTAGIHSCALMPRGLGEQKEEGRDGGLSSAQWLSLEVTNRAEAVDSMELMSSLYWGGGERAQCSGDSSAGSAHELCVHSSTCNWVFEEPAQSVCFSS